MARRKRAKVPKGVNPRWSSSMVNTGTRVNMQFREYAHPKVTGWAFRQEYPDDAVHKHKEFYMEQDSSNRRVMVLKEIEKLLTHRGLIDHVCEYNRIKLLVLAHRSWWLYFSGNKYHILHEDTKKRIIQISCQYSNRNVAMTYWQTGQVWYQTCIDIPPDPG